MVVRFDALRRLFEDFVDDAEFLAAVDPLNAAHALLPFGVGL
jgi:hypothetical protein